MALLHADMDLSGGVSAATDMYAFANGGWLKKHPQPPGGASSFQTVDILKDATQKQLLGFVQAQDDAGDTRVADMFASGVNTKRRNQLGLTPLKPYINMIAVLATSASLVELLAQLHPLGVKAAFKIEPKPDPKEPTMMRLSASQGGIGLPDRNQYFDEAKQKTRGAYIDHIEKVLKAAFDEGVRIHSGADEQLRDQDVRKRAQAVFDLEEQMAAAHLTSKVMRDKNRVYHRMKVTEVGGGGQYFVTYLNALGVKSSTVILDNPAFFNRIGHLLKQEMHISVWKSYLLWCLLRDSSDYISTNFGDLNFEFFQKELLGSKKPAPTKDAVLSTVSKILDVQMAKMYIAKQFSPEAKKNAVQMLEHMRHVLRTRILNLGWMGKQTQEKAIEKLKAMKFNVGYPDKWANDSDIVINTDAAYITNVWSGTKSKHLRKINTLDKEVDADNGWIDLPPFQIGAFYIALQNTVILTAALLQPPFFVIPTTDNPEGDPAVNFGGIGAIIGHEMTHGFDNEGRQYDGAGKLVQWWTPQDESNFNAKAKSLIDQFSAFKLEGKHVNGQLTLGENIADLGGVKLAYLALDAYWKSSHSIGEPGQKVNGFSGRQRFFLAYARNFREVAVQATVIDNLEHNPHSPGRYRVNGILPHLVEFHTAFGVKSGDPMFLEPNQRNQIW